MEDKTIDILCTLGPSSLNERTIKRLEETGVSLFRINLSHTRKEDIENVVRAIQEYTNVPVCLDTEGPQVRTGNVEGNKIFLVERSKVMLLKKKVTGTSEELQMRPESVFASLRIGDLVSIDFDSVLLAVTAIKPEGVEAEVICEGSVGSNKAVTIDRKIHMPILSDKDKIGIDVSKKFGLKSLSLSFVNTKEDVEEVRELIGHETRIISKIETSSALENLDAILSISDAVLIDRGDLSREEPISKLPLLQKAIIEKGKKYNTPVYVATNLLESMVHTRKPLRSEVNDIMNTLLDGAKGLVLAAETAIGEYPIECANMVKRMIKYYQIARNGYSLEDLLKNDSFLLIEPHGGVLIDRFDESIDPASLSDLRKVAIDTMALMDVEQIALGTYSPLKGFMDKEDLDSVLCNYRLNNNVVWTLPIILQIKEDEYDLCKSVSRVALVYEGDNEIYGFMTSAEVYEIDLEDIAVKWFGTSDKSHPGVKRLFSKGKYILGGDITLVKRKPSAYKEFEITPKQARYIFEHKEWSKVAGFHTRNPIHRAHEFLQTEALRRYQLDGLFLHPVIGPKKPGDFLPNVILDSYKTVMDKIYPKNTAVMGAFSTYSRYAGPREAVFTALCRKNFGCSHFIMGRDHTGVEDFYNGGIVRDIHAEIGDIGIKPIYFDTVYYCKECKRYVEDCDHKDTGSMHISGTGARKMFTSGKCPPGWYMREDISLGILDKIKNGEEVFVK